MDQDHADSSGGAPDWPRWARRVASGLIVFQFASVIAAELAAPPASPLERALAEPFGPYYQAVDQGHAHRYYADIPPTPIVTAELRFEDGRPNKTIRIPERSLRPRLLYQRHLAIANTLAQEASVGHAHGGPGEAAPTAYARSVARHLGEANPGCSGVVLRLQLHLMPEVDRMVQAALDPDAPRIDLDADEFYTTPQRIGDFPCPPR